MINEEALAHFKNHEYMTDFSWQDEMSEIAIDAIEKQIPKKPLNYYRYGTMFYAFDWECPCCGKGYGRAVEKVKYCKDCGQKILWEGEEK